MDLRTETVGLVLAVKTKKDFKISFEFQYIFTIHNDSVQLADRTGKWAQYAHQLDRNTGGVTGGAVAPPRPTPPPPPRPVPPVTTPSNQSVGLTREQERSGNVPQWTTSGWAAPPPSSTRPPSVPQMNEHFGYSRNEYRYGGGAQWTSSGWAAGKTSLQIQTHIIATFTRNVCATNCLVTIFGHQITFTRDLYESLTQNSNFVRSHDIEITGLVAVLMQHPLMNFENATRIISETMLTLGIRPGLFDAIERGVLDALNARNRPTGNYSITIPGPPNSVIYQSVSLSVSMRQAYRYLPRGRSDFDALANSLRSLFTLNLSNVAGSTVGLTQESGQFSSTVSASLESVSASVGMRINSQVSVSSGVKLSREKLKMIVYTSFSKSPVSGVSVAYTVGVYVDINQDNPPNTPGDSSDWPLAAVAALCMETILRILSSGDGGGTGGGGTNVTHVDFDSGTASTRPATNDEIAAISAGAVLVIGGLTVLGFIFGGPLGATAAAATGIILLAPQDDINNNSPPQLWDH